MASMARVGLVLLTVVCVVACSVRGPAPSSPPPSFGSPTASARPSATPSVIPSGSPVSESPVPSQSALEDGWRHNVHCDEPPDDATLAPCRATLIDASGVDQPGWPVELPGPCDPFVTSATGVLFTACRDIAGGTVDTLVHALGVDGAELAGWPVRLACRLADLSWNNLEFGCGDRVPAMAVGTDVAYLAMAADGRPELHAIARTGARVDGFPRRLPGDGTTVCEGGFVVAPDGSVRAWGYEGSIGDGGLGYSPFARRTVFEAIATDGSTMPGWPIGATGTSSGPIVSADGTLFHVTEAGNLWAHDPAGNSGPEWPYALPYPARPYPTPDGRVLFIFSEETGDRLLAIRTSGGVAPGWPVDLAGRRESVCFAEDVDCYGFVPPAIGPDGTLYLSLASQGAGEGGGIIAIDPSGAIVEGWPVKFGPRIRVMSVRADQAGNLTVEPVFCVDAACTSAVESDGLTISSSGVVLGG